MQGLVHRSHRRVRPKALDDLAVQAFTVDADVLQLQQVVQIPSWERSIIHEEDIEHQSACVPTNRRLPQPGGQLEPVRGQWPLLSRERCHLMCIDASGKAGNFTPQSDSPSTNISSSLVFPSSSVP